MPYEWRTSQETLKIRNVYYIYVKLLSTLWKADGDDTHIADLLAALGNLVIRGIQHCGVLRLGTLILLSVLPLQEVMGKK